jgi:hypothetical protein
VDKGFGNLFALLEQNNIEEPAGSAERSFSTMCCNNLRPKLWLISSFSINAAVSSSN